MLNTEAVFDCCSVIKDKFFLSCPLSPFMSACHCLDGVLGLRPVLAQLRAGDFHDPTVSIHGRATRFTARYGGWYYVHFRAQNPESNPSVSGRESGGFTAQKQWGGEGLFVDISYIFIHTHTVHIFEVCERFCFCWLCEVQEITFMMTKTLESTRNDDSFNLFWQRIITEGKSKAVNDPEKSTRKEGGCISGSVETDIFRLLN